MEANRDAANQSLIVASRARQEGNLDKALKFAQKSQDLFPTAQGAAVLAAVLEAIGAGSSTSAKAEAEAPGTSDDASSASVRGSSADARAPATAAAAPAAPPPAAAAAPVYSELVRRILGARTFYDVLSVPWAAEETEIRKAYRKLAVQLHPDKNDSPGAEEAFKSLDAVYKAVVP